MWNALQYECERSQSFGSVFRQTDPKRVLAAALDAPSAPPDVARNPGYHESMDDVAPSS